MPGRQWILPGVWARPANRLLRHKMLTVLIFLPALCVWTGFGLLHLLPIKRTSLDAATAIFLSLVSGVLLLGWVATAATELGVFRAEAIVVLGVLVGAAGAWRAKRHGVKIAFEPTPRLEAAFLIALIGLMIALYFRPHEFIFGGADAGVYVNLGATISRSGGLTLNNPDLAALSSDDIAMLFRPQPDLMIYLPQNFLPLQTQSSLLMACFQT